MSKINRALLIGWVARDARTIEQDGHYKSGTVINCVGNQRPTGDGDPILSKHSIILASYSKQYGEQLENLKENDIILVKGTVTTLETIKGKKTCPNCGRQLDVKGTVTYVSPLSVVVIKHAESAQEAYEYLRERAPKEMSNEVWVEGNVCNTPNEFNTTSGIGIRYLLAVPRNTRLPESITQDTDFPSILSFNDKAKDQLAKINVGTQVLVNGRLSSAHHFRSGECPECGAIYNYEESCLEIIPYDVEYLRHYNEKGGEKGYIAE